MSAELICELVDNVGRRVDANDAHMVWQECNVLSDQLDRINPDNIPQTETAADFLRGAKIVKSWAKDIRGANLGAWDTIAQWLKRGALAYIEPVRQKGSSFVRGLMGYDFVETFGEKFVCDLLSYFDTDRENDIEWKREKITALWRYYESNRKEIDSFDSDFRRIIGMIPNEFTIRHGDSRQKTSEFLLTHSQRDYERMLDYLMSTMLTSFAHQNFSKSLKHKLGALLTSTDEKH